MGKIKITKRADDSQQVSAKNTKGVVLGKWSAVIGVLSFLFWCNAPIAKPHDSTLTFPYGVATLAPTTCKQGITARFFGTTTITLSDGQQTLLTDGFFSRPNLYKLPFSTFSPDERRINHALAAGHIGKVDGLLVSHSHHDHAMDAGLVAQKTGATVYGSPSVSNIAKGQGLANDRIRIIHDGDTATFGKFKVTFYQTPHSGNEEITEGITEPLHSPARLYDYKLDENYSFYIQQGARKILIVPSGNYIPGKFSHLTADTVFLGVGGIGRQSANFISTYWDEVVKATGAKQVILIHWDNFTKPLSQPLSPLPYWANHTSDIFKQMQQLAKRDHVQVALMPVFTPINIACQP